MLFLYPEIRGQIEVMAIVVVLGCLLSIWIVFGRGWWFARVCITFAAVLALLPIRAYQPIVWFVFMILMSVASLMPLRWWSERVSAPSIAPLQPAGRWMVVLSAVIGCVVACYSLDRVGARAPGLGWREMAWVFGFVFFAVVLGLISLFQRLKSRGPLTPRREGQSRQQTGFKFSLSDALLVTGLLAFAAAITMYALRLKPIEDVGHFLGSAGLVVTTTWLVAAVAVVRHLPTQLFAFVVLIAVVLLGEQQLGPTLRWCSETSAYGTLRANQAQFAMAVTARGFTLVLLASTCIAVASGWYCWQLEAVGSRRAVTTLARIAVITLTVVALASILPIYAKMIPSLPPRTFASVPSEQAVYAALRSEVLRLQPLVNAAKDPLPESTMQKFDSLLNERFAVRGDHQFNANFSAQFTAFRAVARSMQQRSQDAAMQQRYGDALEHALQSVRMGAGLARGGTLSHSLMGIAIEISSGYRILATIRDDIPIERIPGLIAELDTIEQNRETLASYKAAADLDCERDFGWRYRLSLVAFSLSSAKPEHCHTVVTPTLQATEESIIRRDIMNRLLKTQLAIRWFESQRGHRPDSLEELVPEFLSSVPMDPFIDRPLVYHNVGEGFELYGVGWDRVDDGGRFGNEANMYGGGFDYDIDNMSR
ncbi:hypothetical protein [Aporhodopirellula aestuarii]|uniref:Type II secretion system protein GspG C-terminal domain-containing protein n=1 Tax=Aporhodopirellula aestuarii TaxID=2950107 RepID=A0ABT0UBY7_9BACT|nr:hypothetical protein [Aporhodopirellula aestuarii]MCM2374512.1 hypothetical protein [Aporhodopirellula aestuarii]